MAVESGLRARARRGDEAGPAPFGSLGEETSEEAMRRALNAMQLRLVEESEARFRAERLWCYHASRG